MPGSHQSSLLNRSELVSQSVSDKGKQWSDSGPIKRGKMGRLTKAGKCCERWPRWLAGWIKVSNQSWRKRTHRCGRLFACKRGHTDENCKGERRGGCRNIKTKVKKKETFPWTRGKMNPVLGKNSITDGDSTAIKLQKRISSCKKGLSTRVTVGRYPGDRGQVCIEFSSDSKNLMPQI